MPNSDTVDSTHESRIAPTRAEGLDALRGMAILAMALSGLVPQGVLPKWMYHAQVPPPDHVFNPSIPGLTWVDLVFPFFLFSMGVSIPLALSRRIEKGAGALELAVHVVKRGVLLTFFGVYIQHIKPYELSPTPNTATWLTAMLGFGLLFPIFLRLPSRISGSRQMTIRAVGWILIAVFLVWLKYPDHEHPGFWMGRRDIIIVVLANVSISGSIVWLLTRRALEFRLMVMLGLIAIRLAHDSGGWVQSAWNWSPIPSLYTLYFHQYLLVVLPGTIVGDLMVQRLQATSKSPTMSGAWSGLKAQSVALICMGLTCFVCMGLQIRWLPHTSFIATALSVLAVVVWGRGGSASSCFARTVFGWATAWLIVGLLFEPFEGGIKKDHPTVSYYFVTVGLGMYMLVALNIFIEQCDLRTIFALPIGNGQNPLLAYAAISNLLAPALALSGLGAVMASVFGSPWAGFFSAVLKTLLLGLAVMLLTRKRLIWRA